jgi:hypothetical protein
MIVGIYTRFAAVKNWPTRVDEWTWTAVYLVMGWAIFMFMRPHLAPSTAQPFVRRGALCELASIEVPAPVPRYRLVHLGAGRGWPSLRGDSCTAVCCRRCRFDA